MDTKKLVQKTFYPQCFYLTKFWSKQIFSSKVFMSKYFWVKRILGSKNFWIQKNVGQKHFGSNNWHQEKTDRNLFLARATVGTLLYASLCRLVSAFLFFKTYIMVLLDHVGSWNFARKSYVLVSIHPTIQRILAEQCHTQNFYPRKKHD